jgi:hypothetical protein
MATDGADRRGCYDCGDYRTAHDDGKEVDRGRLSLQEALNKTNVAFGKSSAEMEKWARAARARSVCRKRAALENVSRSADVQIAWAYG